MIDQKTGRFTWGEGKELYPGMTHADFEKTVLYHHELLNEQYKTNREQFSCNIKEQDIDGFEMYIRLTFDHDNFLSDIIMSRPDYYSWPNWPKDRSDDEFMQEIKLHNDRFLATQFRGQIEGGRELGFSFDWGTIRSTFSYVHTPDIEVVISFRTWRFKDEIIDDGRPLSEIIQDIYDKK